MWFIALGSLKLPNFFYENIYTYHIQPYNSFRIKCNAINDFRKDCLNIETVGAVINLELFKIILGGENTRVEKTDAENTKVKLLPEEMKEIQKLVEKYQLSYWKEEDSYGYPYLECLTKQLKDCSYEGWDMWYLSFLMSLLYVVGIASVIFNLPIMGTALKRFPITRGVAKALMFIGLLLDTPNLPIFAVFIVVIVSMFWGAIANRYQTNCQDVIDAKDEWYDNVPTYAVGGSLAVALIDFLIKEHQVSKIRETIEEKIQVLKNKKANQARAKNNSFLGVGNKGFNDFK